MSARPHRTLDRAPVWARRSLMIALPLLLVAVLLAGFALAPTPATHRAGRRTATADFFPHGGCGSLDRPPRAR
jgi:hypothetical protein